jgi:hypothetical protein
VEADSFIEDLDRRFGGAMEEKFGTPVEEVGFGGIVPGGSLVLADGG